MRIIADNHDYYDCMQSYGQDRTIIYKRKPKEIVFYRTPENKYKDNYPFTTIENVYRSGHKDISKKDYTIGFAGKLYPLVRMATYKKNCYPEIENITYCYTLEAIEAFIGQHLSDSDVAKFYEKRYNFIWHKLGYQTYKNFFSWFKDNSIKFSNIFTDNSSPIFVGTTKQNNRTITFNTTLKELAFYKVLDPFTAFQELQMWMSNQAVPHKPIPKVSDKDLASAKGFDRWSFRKEPK